MQEKKGLFSAKSLACYIKQYYYDHFKRDISPIKLQKSLYFCFAYWGGHVRKSLLPETEITIEKSDWLFDENIEAWVYGPVVPDVYHELDLDSYKDENLFKGNEDVQEFINGILDDIISVSDFKLVEVSHSDQCWIDKFDPNAEHHNEVIDKESIIEEYAKIY